MSDSNCSCSSCDCSQCSWSSDEECKGKGKNSDAGKVLTAKVDSDHADHESSGKRCEAGWQRETTTELGSIDEKYQKSELDESFVIMGRATRQHEGDFSEFSSFSSFETDGNVTITPNADDNVISASGTLENLNESLFEVPKMSSTRKSSEEQSLSIKRLTPVEETKSLLDQECLKNAFQLSPRTGTISASTAYEDVINQLEKEKRHWQLYIQEIRPERDSLANKIKTMSDIFHKERLEMKRSLKELLDTVHVLETRRMSQLNEEASFKSKRRTSENEANELNERIRSLLKQKTQITTSVESAEEDLMELQKRIKEVNLNLSHQHEKLDEHQNTTKRLRRELEEQTDKSHALCNQHQFLLRRVTEMGTHNTNMEEKLSDIERELVIVRQNSMEKDHEINSLQGEEKALEKSLGKSLMDLQERQHQVSELTQKTILRDQDIKGLLGMIESLQIENRKLNGEISDLTRDSSMVSKALESSDETFLKKRHAYHECLQLMSRYQEHLDIKENEKAEVMHSIQKAKKNKEFLMSVEEKSCKEIDYMSKILEEKHMELDASAQVLAVQDREIHQLMNIQSGTIEEINQLTQALGNAESKFKRVIEDQKRIQNDLNSAGFHHHQLLSTRELLLQQLRDEQYNPSLSLVSGMCTPIGNHGPMSHGHVNHGPMSHGPVNHGPVSHGPGNHGPMNHGIGNHGALNHGLRNHGPMNHGPGNHGPMNHGPGNHGSKNHGPVNHGLVHNGSKNRAVTYQGPVNHGQINHGAINQEQLNHEAINHGPAIRNQIKHGSMNHPQVNHPTINCNKSDSRYIVEKKERPYRNYCDQRTPVRP